MSVIVLSMVFVERSDFCRTLGGKKRNEFPVSVPAASNYWKVQRT